MKLLGFTILFIIFSCNQKEKNNHSNKTETTNNVNENFIIDTIQKKQDILDLENLEINNIKILLSKTEFDSINTKIDSISVRNWECGNPLEWLDEKWMTLKYGNKVKGSFKNYNGDLTSIYFNNICYVTNNHLTLFKSLNTSNNIVKLEYNKKIMKLSSTTTIKKFKSIFQNSEFEKTENLNEIRFRILINKDDLNAFLFYFKNGKFNKLELWWDLC